MAQQSRNESAESTEMRETRKHEQPESAAVLTSFTPKEEKALKVSSSHRDSIKCVLGQMKIS